MGRGAALPLYPVPGYLLGMGSFQRFTSVELSARPGQIIDTALGGVAIITRHKRDAIVMISVNEYRRLLAAAGEPWPETATTTQEEGT